MIEPGSIAAELQRTAGHQTRHAMFVPDASLADEHINAAPLNVDLPGLDSL